MRFPLLHCLALLTGGSWLHHQSLGEQPPSVSLATHQQELRPSLVDVQALQRIRQIVLHQGENPRALANLVQLTRDLDAATAAQLFSDLADDYLRQGKYDQAANFLQQLVNQHVAQSAARGGLLKLMQLYSSSEVHHTQAATSAAAGEQASYCQYALHLANETLRRNSALSEDPAISFQRAATARGANHSQQTNGFLTRLKHSTAAGPWRDRAKAEQWLLEGRKSEPPLSVNLCRRAAQRPHLDGELTEPSWQSGQTIQLAYDQEFLYLAVRYEKLAGIEYKADPRPRAHDADLTAHDHLRLRLDLDRDFATCFELAVDHRGWTSDRCWLDTSWNPKWYVAAAGDDSAWVIEAAIPWDQLTHSPPQSGQAWAVAFERAQPSADPQIARSADAGAQLEPSFSLLLFE